VLAAVDEPMKWGEGMFYNVAVGAFVVVVLVDVDVVVVLCETKNPMEFGGAIAIEHEEYH
jgi:hypothetical protein